MTPGASGGALPTDEIDDLLRVAHAAALLAYSPYSKVRVGAALLSVEGEVFTGCNVENASFGLTLCAERVALTKAISSGVNTFRVMAIATSLKAPLMPCGACRQVMYEFAPELLVISQGMEGPRAEARLGELLPKAFRPSDLDPDALGGA